MNTKNINYLKKDLKILFVSISHSYKYSNAGIDQLAGYLRGIGYNADIKYFHKRESLNDILDSIPYNYDIYGFSIYPSNLLTFYEISKFIKIKNPKSKIIFGGSFVSMYYKSILDEFKYLDYIILGDGEKPLELLLSHIEEKPYDEFTHVSIASHCDFEYKKIHCNKEILHKPAFDFYKYDTTEQNMKKTHCIQTKNNICTGQCSFCFERKGAIVYKDIDQIVEEIDFVSTKYNIKRFYFADDNLLDPNTELAKKRIYELCLKIKGLNKKLIFTGFIKATSFIDSDLDHELLDLMSEVGFGTLFIGIESGNNRDLLLYNKRTTVNDNYTVINLLRQHRISPLIGFINFNPYSTKSTLKENFEFLSNINSINLSHYIGAFLLLYKDTEIYKKVEHDNLLKDTYNFLNTLDYNFLNKDCEEILQFIRDHLSPDLTCLRLELNWLINYYSECLKLDPTLIRYESELELLYNEHLDIIRTYFAKLFIENDLEWCLNNKTDFISYFKNIQPQLIDMYNIFANSYIYI